MKLLFAAIFLVSTFTVAFSQQCDSRGITGLMQCYNNMLNTFDVPFSRNISEIFNNPKMRTMEIPTFCKAYTEKNKCLGDDYEKKCINALSFSKAFGLNSREGMEFLMMEYFSQYLCKKNKDYPKTQCIFDNAALVNRCAYLRSTTSGCEFVSSALQCFNDGMMQQCNDKNFVEFILKGFRFIFQKTLPFCGL